jgi:hypothetical protein
MTGRRTLSPGMGRRGHVRQGARRRPAKAGSGQSSGRGGHQVDEQVAQLVDEVARAAVADVADVGVADAVEHRDAQAEQRQAQALEAWRPCAWVISTSQPAAWPPAPGLPGRRSPPRWRAARQHRALGGGDADRQLHAHLGQEAAGANSRSGSAPMATRLLPRWKWPSSMASTSWPRWRRRRAGAGRPDSADSAIRASVAVRPVRRSNRVKGTPQRAPGARRPRASARPGPRVRGRPGRGCRPGRAAQRGGQEVVGMWPSSEPETSGTITGSGRRLR